MSCVTTRGWRLASVITISCSLAGAACGSGSDAPAPEGAKAKAKPATKKPPKTTDKPDWEWPLPSGLGFPPEIPTDNPMSKDKVALGHKLFMDKRLSVDGSRSCYSCHQNHLGNADGRPKALGAAKKPLPRNSPTIWNVALQPALYWDGRAPTLEKQAVGALKGGNMGLGDTLEAKAAEIGALPEYKDEFSKVFALGADTKVTSQHIAMALSAYERTLLCGDTKVDNEELDEAQKRGLELFVGKAACVTCHVPPNFSDGSFHVVGVGIDPADKNVDLGRGKVTGKEEDNYKFRTPTLRNVSKTAPYFHDGSVAKLEDAVRLMAGGGVRDKVKVDDKLRNVNLNDDEIADLVAFLSGMECPQTLEVIGDQTAEGIATPS